MTTIEEGRVVCQMPASPWLVGPKGRIHAGILAFLVDAPLYYAVHSTMPAGVLSTTAEISLTFLGDAPDVGGELTADARMVYVDTKNALSEVFVSDSRGRLVAHGTSRLFVFPRSATPASSAADLEPWVEPEYAEPDPWMRPVRGAALAPEVFETLTGLQILQRQMAGELPSPPINHLTGMRIVAVEPGSISFALPLGPWMMNELGTFYGGALAMLAKSTTAAAVQTVATARTRFTALDLKVNFLRAPVLDGSELVATGTVCHRGRLAIATTDIFDANGKQVATATGSTMLDRPARPAH